MSRVYLPPGLESAPSMTFSIEPVTGIYLQSPGPTSSLALTKRGKRKIEVLDEEVKIDGDLKVDGSIIPTTGKLGLDDSTFTEPSLYFKSRPSTGVSFTSPNLYFGHDDVGTFKGYFTNASYSTNSIPFRLPASEPGVPQLCFSGSVDGTSSGLSYKASPSALSLNVSGQEKMKLTTDGVEVDGKVGLDDNPSSTPSLYFKSEPSRGLTCLSNTLWLGRYDSGSFLGYTTNDTYSLNTIPLRFKESSPGTPQVCFSGSSDGTGSGLSYESSPSVLSINVSGSAKMQITTDEIKCGTNSITSSSSLSSWPLKTDIYWGDASDGDVKITGGTTNLTKDMYYDTLTLESSAVIETKQYRIYAKTITGDGTGIIRNNGANGGNGTGSGGGPQGVGILTTGTGRTFASVNGGNGGGVGPGNGGNGGNTGMGIGGGSGARGGDSKSGQTGGTGGVQSVSISFLQHNLSGWLSLPTSTGIYATGGAGGGGGGFTGSGGGGGGAAAGVVWIQAETLGGISMVEAKGGNGGNSFDSNSGCGGGGGGGLIYILYKSLAPGFDINSSTDVSGGSNGTGNTTGATTAQAGQKILQQLD